MQSLLVAESTPKVMRLLRFAKDLRPDERWVTATTAGFRVRLDRYDVDTGKHSLKVLDRRQMNRIVQAAVECQRVYLATRPNRFGDGLAADLAGQMLSRYPELDIQRLRVDPITESAFRAAIDLATPIGPDDAAAHHAGRIVDFLARAAAQKVASESPGRATLALLALLVRASRPGLARVAVDMANGMRLLSDFVPAEQAEQAHQAGVTDAEWLSETSEVVTLQPPELPSAASIVADASRTLGLRAAEALRQLTLLYELGEVATWQLVSSAYEADAREALELFGSAPGCTSLVGAGGCLPVDVGKLPSRIDRPVRDVYRLLWATMLAAFSQPMRVRRTRLRLRVGDVEARGHYSRAIEQGFDSVSFGLLYWRDNPEENDTPLRMRLYSGGPFEHELLAEASTGIENPTAALMAAANQGYLALDGAEVVLTERGQLLVAALEQHIPQLLDPQFFAATEAVLDSYRAAELIEPWRKWLNSVKHAVRLGQPAYLK
jgi:DNA topoisomerase IA